MLIRPASPALVMNIFPPLIVYPLPFFIAVVLVAPASLPASCSVKPKAPIIWPEANGGTYFFFCSSVPAIKMGIVPNDVCAAMVMATEASALANSITAAA